jgi:hypothetical protein
MSGAMKQSEFASQQGWSASYVTKLKQQGRLVFTDDGKVDVAQSLAKIAATSDPNRDDVSARHAANRKKKPDAQPVAPPEPKAPQSPADESFQKSRAVKERYLALTAKAEYERMIGKMADVESVRIAGADVGAALRAVLENLVDHLTPLLAAETEEPNVHRILREHMDQALHDIINRLESALQAITEEDKAA